MGGLPKLITHPLGYVALTIFILAGTDDFDEPIRLVDDIDDVAGIAGWQLPLDLLAAGQADDDRCR